MAGRCRCGAGKFLRCGSAGARQDELPVPKAGNGQCQALLTGNSTRWHWDTTEGVLWVLGRCWCHVLAPSGWVYPKPSNICCSQAPGIRALWVVGSVGSGWDGLPAWLCAHRANGIKGVFTGRRKEEAGGFSRAQKPHFMCWEWETQAIELSKEKVGSIWWLGSLAVLTASAGAGAGGCLPPNHLLPSGLG